MFTTNTAGRTTSLRGDGRSDLLVRNYYTGELLAFLHRGVLDGLDTYEKPIVVSDAFGPRSVWWLSVGDFTGDGRADVFAMDVAARCWLHPNVNGLDGLTATAAEVACADISHDVYHSILLADVDGDGKVDIVGRRAGAGEVEVLLNEYDGEGFRFAAPKPLATLRNTDYLIGMADVTLNGRLDLVVSRVGGEVAALELGPGGGTWHPVLDVPGGVRVVAVSDVDGDGCPDLLAVRADGALVAFPHVGNFRPGDPLSTYPEPVVVGLGWGEFDIIN
jgi:hypothetical protein